MRKKKCSPHDTIHLIGAILVPLKYDTFLKKLGFHGFVFSYQWFGWSCDLKMIFQEL